MREDRALQLLCELSLNSSPHPQMLDELRQLSSAERDEFLRLAEVEKGGGDLECVVRTEVIGGAPQRASLCEIRPLAGVQHVQSG